MRSLLIGSALLALLFICRPVLAQQEVARMCNAVLADGMRDNYDLLSARTRLEIFQDRLCEAQFESYQQYRGSGATLGLDIPLVDGILGLSGSSDERSGQFSEKYSAFCRSTFFEEQSSDYLRTSATRISDVLATSWTRCVELHLDAWLRAHGVFVAISPVGDLDSFVVEISIRSEDLGDVVITAIHPDGKIVCMRAGARVEYGVTTIDRQGFLLTCQKNPYESVPFAIETNKGRSRPVVLPAATSLLVELAAEVEELRGEISNLQLLLQEEVASHATTRDRIARLRLRPAGCRWLCGDSQWCNVYRADFDAPCGADEFVAGVKSTFSHDRSDRGYNLLCCKVFASTE